MSATNAQVIAKLETIVADHVALAITSYLDPPALAGQASIGVVDGDRIRSASDAEYTGALVDVTVLVPIDETAADFEAEKEARQASAQTLFEAIKGEIGGTFAPWRSPWQESRPRFSLVRPQPHLLCAGASCTFGFAL